MEASNTPQEPQSVGGPTPLQNGVDSHPQGVAAEGRLFNKAGLEGCILVRPNPSESPTLPEIYLDGSVVAVQNPPLQPKQRPRVFTKIIKPITSTLRKLGIRLILYLDDMLIMSPTQEEAASNLSSG